jgi:molybdate transport system regulatory protein
MSAPGLVDSQLAPTRKPTCCAANRASRPTRPKGLAMDQLDKLETSVRLSVRNPLSESTSVFGRGVADLCLGVRTHGSLNAAAKHMGMAYSKAWRIIKDTEAALDVQLLNRDGAHGSELTEEGGRILDTYIAINNRLQAEAQQLFAELTS